MITVIVLSFFNLYFYTRLIEKGDRLSWKIAKTVYGIVEKRQEREQKNYQSEKGRNSCYLNSKT